MPLTEQEAPRYTQWAPRPLVTLTIGATTKQYSTEDVEDLGADYGVGDYGDMDYGA